MSTHAPNQQHQPDDAMNPFIPLPVHYSHSTETPCLPSTVNEDNNTMPVDPITVAGNTQEPVPLIPAAIGNHNGQHLLMPERQQLHQQHQHHHQHQHHYHYFHHHHHHHHQQQQQHHQQRQQYQQQAHAGNKRKRLWSRNSKHSPEVTAALESIAAAERKRQKTEENLQDANQRWNEVKGRVRLLSNRHLLHPSASELNIARDCNAPEQTGGNNRSLQTQYGGIKRNFQKGEAQYDDDTRNNDGNTGSIATKNDSNEEHHDVDAIGNMSTNSDNGKKSSSYLQETDDSNSDCISLKKSLPLLYHEANADEKKLAALPSSSSKLPTERESSTSKMTNRGQKAASDRWSGQFEKRFQQLIEFKKNHGHCNVTVPSYRKQNNKDTMDDELRFLGSWVKHQREYYRLAQAKDERAMRLLTAERIQRLKDIGFVFNANEYNWKQKYEELIKYKEIHNGNYSQMLDKKHSNHDKKIAQFIRTQRQEYSNLKKGKATKITDERIKLLKDIKFNWGRISLTKQKQSISITVGRGSERNCHEGKTKIGRLAMVAVSKVKLNSKKKDDSHLNEISKPGHKKDESINVKTTITASAAAIPTIVDKDAEKKTWNEMYMELKAFFQEHGHCSVHSSDAPKREKHYRLVNWVSWQRKQYRLHLEDKATQMTEERIELLETLGFNWGLPKQVVDALSVVDEAKRLKEEADKEIEQLNDTLVETVLQEKGQWNNMYQKLLEYKQINGHCLVPIRSKHTTVPADPELKVLGRWVKNQRLFYRLYQAGDKSHIQPWRISALNKIGFVWNVSENQWDCRFSETTKFKEENGHTQVSRSHDLYSWLRNQREQMFEFKMGRPSSLTAEKVTKLEDIGIQHSEKQNKNAKVPKAPKEVWQEGYDRLVEFHREYGHVEVNRGGGRVSQSRRKLQQWCAFVRKEFILRESNGSNDESIILTTERIRLLQNLGFKFKRPVSEPREWFGKKIKKSPAAKDSKTFEV